jgi:hypothetical protein
MGLKWLHETILGVLLFLVGMALFFRADQIVGDLGDSRFNMYVLEHGYRWLAGLTSHSGQPHFSIRRRTSSPIPTII